MTISISKEVLSELKHQSFERYSYYLSPNRGKETKADIDLGRLPDEAIDELSKVADEKNARSLKRILKAFVASRSGDFSEKIPKTEASLEIMQNYIKHEAIDGWVYIADENGLYLPELVSSVRLEYSRNEPGKPPVLVLVTVAITKSDESRSKYAVASCRKTYGFHAEDIVNRTVSEVLLSRDILKETEELKKEYDGYIQRHMDVIMPAFAKQFRFNGMAIEEHGYYKRPEKLSNRKVIYDLEESDYAGIVAYADALAFEDMADDTEEHGRIPLHPLVRVFDLKAHKFYWANSVLLEPYEYDKTLDSKIVLPKTHRGLLNVLTRDLTHFTGDMIEGKSTGNIILCTGVPGIGKTLTAEVYSESLEIPLYSIHSGNLGTTAEDIHKNLEMIFERAKRWGCVLLLDEADVFVAERGTSIEQNAICAEFLRSLEYFDGLLFMTTNRHDNIDDAIISRCLAIVRYNPAEGDDARALWKILSSMLGNQLSDEMISDLLDVFPKAVGREIKMLCGTVFRMEKAGEWKIDIEGFEKAAMFRGVESAMHRSKDAVRGVTDKALSDQIAAIQNEMEAELGFRPSAVDAIAYIKKTKESYAELLADEFTD